MQKLTRYAFISHMEAFIKRLLNDPMHSDTDALLKVYGITAPKAISMLTATPDPSNPESAVLIKKVNIKDNGTDENGKRLPDSFMVKYNIIRKNYTEKMHEIYNKIKDSEKVKKNNTSEINEDGESGGAVAADSSGQYSQPLFKKPIKRRIVQITQEQADYIKSKLNETVTTTNVGDITYDAPFGNKNGNKGNEFFKDANKHKNIMSNSRLK